MNLDQARFFKQNNQSVWTKITLCLLLFHLSSLCLSCNVSEETGQNMMDDNAGMSSLMMDRALRPPVNGDGDVNDGEMGNKPSDLAVGRDDLAVGRDDLAVGRDDLAVGRDDLGMDQGHIVDVGDVDANVQPPECVDVRECPPPPPVAIVECEDNWVVDVTFRSLCTEEGRCAQERVIHQIHDCSLDERICEEGVCVQPLIPELMTCGLDSEECSSSEYCVATSGMCGATGFESGQAACAPRARRCEPMNEPVCGCDGVLYDSSCVASSFGVDVSRYGGCVIDGGGVSCGALECSDDEYCMIQLNDVVDGPPLFAQCVLLPAECMDAPLCETCFMPDPFMTCSDATGAVIIVYPGG